MHGTTRVGSEADALFVRSYQHDGQLVIEAVGAVTSHTKSVLAETLCRSAECAALPVTLDLRQVSLVDNSGLTFLIDMSKRLRSPGVPLAPRVLVTPGDQPERVLLTSGFDKILEIKSWR